MASKMLGRAPCPECSFASAHVKINTEKETAKAYRHCPECGAQYFPRNAAQAEQLLAKLHPGKIDGLLPGAPGVRVQIPTPPEPAPAPVPTFKIVLGARVPA